VSLEQIRLCARARTAADALNPFHVVAMYLFMEYFSSRFRHTSTHRINHAVQASLFPPLPGGLWGKMRWLLTYRGK
jgi:hypothetical protein